MFTDARRRIGDAGLSHPVCIQRLRKADCHVARTAVSSAAPDELNLAILQAMSWWRQNRLVQMVSLVLLLWTGADLTNSSLCAVENEDAQSSPIATHAVAVDGQSSPLRSDGPAAHIDDCFCCSHCVEVQGLSTVATATLVERELKALVLSSPRTFGSPLYHPPLV